MSARSRTLALGLVASLAAAHVHAKQPTALESLTDQGRYWQSRGDFKRAAEVWEKLLVANPNNPDALYGLARVALNANDLARANNYLGTLRSTHPQSPLVPSLDQEIYLAQPGPKAELDKARSLAAAEEMDQAIAQYNKVLQGRKPLGNLAREYYNYLGYSTNGLGQAIQGLETIVRSSPNNLTDQLALAKHLIRTENRRTEGLQMLQRLSTQPAVASEATEAWRTALTWIGGSTPEFRGTFEAYLQANPSDTEIRQLLATAPTATPASAQRASSATPRQDPDLARGFKLLESGDLTQAQAAFQSRLQRSPRDADALGGLGLVKMQQNNFAEAQMLLQQAASQKATWGKNLGMVQYWKQINEANQARVNGNFAQARALAEQASKIDQKVAAAHNIIGGTYADEGQPEKAEQAYRRALLGEPRNVEALQGLANALAQTGKIDDASTLLNRLAANRRLDPADVNKLRASIATGRAKAALQSGDQAGAQAALEHALRDDPNNPWIRLDLARLYVKRGNRAEARNLVDSLVQSRPDMTDALYSSALLSADLGEWSAAYATLQRIKPDERTADINTLTRRAGVLVQAEEASTLAQRGNIQQARTILARIEPDAANDAALVGPIASAYVDAGDNARGLALLKDQLQKTGNSTDTLLTYTGLLMKTGNDAQATALMRDLQSRTLTPAQKDSYADLQFFHTVRQADLLREQGNLARAYDVLAPALAQRPNDPSALAALARMYADSGDDKQALNYYKRLIQNDPDNANLQLAAAMSASRTGEKNYAESAIDRALALTPKNPEILAIASRIYRSQGKSGKALDLMTAAVEAENSRIALAASSAPTLASAQPVPAAVQPDVYRNPFSGAAPKGQASRLAANSTPAFAAPRPAEPQVLLAAPAAAAPAPQPTPQIVATAPTLLSEPASAASEPVIRSSAPRTMAPTQPVAPPPLVASPGAAPLEPAAALASLQKNNPPPLKNNAPTQIDNLNQELAELRDLRNPEVTLATTARSNNGESGLSKLDDQQAALQVKLPVGEGKLTLEATAVQLKSGDVDQNYYSRERFGSGSVALYDSIAKNNRWGDAQALNTEAPAGRQRDSGVGVAVGYNYQGLTVDLGSTPLGFQETNIIGGVKYEGLINERDRTWYSADVSRRAVTDSVTSFAGVTDQYSGLKWGGVTATGVQLQAGQDGDRAGIYAYSGWHALRGNNVANNSRTNLGAGIYWHLVRNPNELFTAGLNLGATFYDKNQRFFTYGHGGYFSPQSMYTLSIPFTWAQRSGRFSYRLQGSIGVERFKEDGADYFPTDSLLQAQSQTSVQYARTMGYAGATNLYSGQSKTGLSYNLQGAAEYRLSDHLILGSHLGLNNAKDYRQWGGGLYLRYYFYPSNRDLDLPVKPYRGPYAN